MSNMKSRKEQDKLKRDFAASETVPPGYKKTEVGIIPEDWILSPLENLGIFFKGKGIKKDEVREDGYGCIRYGEIYTKYDHYFTEPQSRIPSCVSINSFPLKKGDLLFTGSGETLEEIGKCVAYLGEREAFAGGDIIILRPHEKLFPLFASYALNFDVVNKQKIRRGQGDAVVHIHADNLANILVPLPPLPEQKAIAEALSDVDELIARLDKLIEKKKAIKTAAMQQLLTGKIRLPGFQKKPGFKKTEVGMIPKDWEVKPLYQTTKCLDNLRIPLNESQRKAIPGPYPYCGANGIVDYIGKYLIDFPVILIAEDGGHFEEYKTRPIAYKMSGKIWVNNHVHILIALENYDQDYIYYSLVHKNILPYLSGGTRAKLNKNQLYFIEIAYPSNKAEQTAIAKVLSDMDAEIEALEKRREKTKAIKKGMMQQLLTGRIRLVEPSGQTNTQAGNERK